MTGWDPTSFSVGLSVGGAAMLAFLLMLFWAQERAERDVTTRPMDEKRQRLMKKLAEKR